MDLDFINAKLQRLRTDYEIKKSAKELLENEIINYNNELREISETMALYSKTSLFLQKVAEHQRKQACAKLEEIATLALQFVMGPSFRLEIEVSAESKKPEAEIYIVSITDGEEMRVRPQESSGGGIVDIVSIALRLAVIEAMGMDGPIILDEPGKHVSREHIVALSEFLKHMSVELDRQIIMVTHSEHMAESADRKILVESVRGSSRVSYA